MNVKNITDRFKIASEREDFNTVHEIMEKGIHFRGTNLWILIFAIFIACVGLNVNSTAVIIGAMLVSPLMGPILGMGYCIATYNFNLLKKALINFLFAVISGLTASTIYFLITPINEAHSELLARTQPNIYDVIIALTGGLAGVLALSSKQKGNVIPGVAIATALMPPLCTAGYGLATGGWTYFFGALYLFTINTVFIGVATLITVRFLEYPIWNNSDPGVRKLANQWVTVIVLVTIIPSIYFGYILVQREKFSQNANSFIHNEGYIDGDYLLKTEINPAKRSIKLVYGGRMIPEEVKKGIIAKTPRYNLANAQITIQQGFSINDQENKDLILADSRNQEINLLRGKIAQHLKVEDSIKSAQQLGIKLLTEIKQFYPAIKSCGISEQVLYSDSLNPRTYMSLFLEAYDEKKLLQDKPKIENWFRSRMAIDSVKIYIE